MRITPGSTVRLSRDHDASATGHVTRAQAGDLLRQGTQLLAGYQDRLAAQNTRGLLVVFQGLDASGKDSTIRHVLSGVNPQGVTVCSFKEPSAGELSHDFLWRYQVALPGRGRIGIFNRSHYEEVLVVRVHPALLEAARSDSPTPHYRHRSGHLSLPSGPGRPERRRHLSPACRVRPAPTSLTCVVRPAARRPGGRVPGGATAGHRHSSRRRRNSRRAAAPGTAGSQ
jgi:hypothetical protein